MSKLEALLGLGIYGLAFVDGAAHGAAYAKGLHIGPTLYTIPLLMGGGFCFGARSTHPEQKIDVPVGAVYAGAAAAVSVVGFLAAYVGHKLVH